MKKIKLLFKGKRKSHPATEVKKQTNSGTFTFSLCLNEVQLFARQVETASMLLYVISTAEVPPTPTLLHCVCFISALAHVFDLLTMLRNIIFFYCSSGRKFGNFCVPGFKKTGGKENKMMHLCSLPAWGLAWGCL